MSTDSGVRRLLPQSSQMQSFNFTPANFMPRENQKNYVFVDEHNRHKRLKVMRACEGCRRRKIKCDAATTNTWPCSACIRLKLHCVPPTVHYEGGNGQGFEPERVEYESGSGDDEYQNHLSMQQHLGGQQKAPPPVYSQQVPYSDGNSMYQPLPYSQPQPPSQTMQYGNIHNAAGVMDGHYSSQNVFPVAPLIQHPQSESPELYSQDQYGQQDLVDILGDLKMDSAGSAPYLINKKKNTSVEEPAFEDVDAYKNSLPTLIAGPDMKVRIPPALMPDESTALQYFDMYFTNVHPYVPVLNKTLFYQQWHSNRDSISPLILEAIFAIAGKLVDEPSQGQQWLALAGKHADSFMDVPRLSTLQALLILLKARESAPKKGYYYRSWMSVVQSVAMAKDLGLDEHYDDHRAGKSCGSSPTDCITKTRMWQTCYVYEVMIGSPQGRTDLSVEQESVDLNIPRPVPGEDSEYHVTRNFTYFTRIINHVRTMNRIYSQLKNKKDWGLQPELSELNPTFEAWLNELPSELHLSFPTDGSLPWLPSHFIGNMHSYYYLGIILLHRPQLSFMEPTGMDGGWKQHMMICYSSAKYLCKIQEALLQQFGMPGLLCMLRGASYTIYCVLTCTVLHLVAITSPDPDLNSDARDFFTRHMRILEKCTSSWPMPEMQQKIDALREAFSADVRKPFVLKPTFPYGSPGAASLATPPPRSMQYQPHGQLSRASSMEQQTLDQNHAQQPQVSYTSHPMTPPISAGGIDSKSDSPAIQSLVMMASGQRVNPQQPPPMSNTIPMVDTSTWNPSRIFDQWNTTFGTPNAPSNGATGPSMIRIPPPSASPEIRDLSTSANMSLAPNSQSIPAQMYSSAPMPSFVSPSMWQESVASVYEGGLKRQWDYDSHGMVNQVMKRTR